MTTNRLEAFSDGVLAIVITIMVLELKVPEGNNLEALYPLIPKFMSYILSFVYVGLYWNNHHHLFHIIEKVNGKILWANLFLLFFLSLVAFSSGWMGENDFAKIPVALYGLNMLACGIAFVILEHAALRNEGENSKIGTVLSNTFKERAAILLYIIGIVLSLFVPLLSVACYTLVAIIWFIPDKRIEQLENNNLN